MNVCEFYGRFHHDLYPEHDVGFIALVEPGTNHPQQGRHSKHDENRHEVERLTEQLIGPLAQSAPGILTLGLAAALGEESIFRGALQPRFGLLLTTVLFALLHSQYGISVSTLLVLIVGLALGVVRTRFNTTTAMIVHAVYNMTLGLITYLGVMQNI